MYREAAFVLAWRVHDDLARNHAADLMPLIEKHHDLESIGWLAARLGSERARCLIAEGKIAPRMQSVHRDLVLGKLGDREAEQRSLERYHKAMMRDGELEDVQTWTAHMGSMATAAAVLALARDLRHPGTYAYLHDVERMVRADVLNGLSRAFPYDVELHQEFTSNEDYGCAERWAEMRLGVTWSEPRPPYVHEVPSSTF